MARAKPTGFAAALESAAKHSKKYKRGHRAFERASRAAKKGWKTRRKRRPFSIAEVAEAQGIRKGIDTALGVLRKAGYPNPRLYEAIDRARELRVHPDLWAGDVSYEFDVSAHDLYEDYFGYEPGAW